MNGHKNKKVSIKHILGISSDVITILLAIYVVIRHQINPYTLDNLGNLLSILIAIIACLATSSLIQNSNISGELLKIINNTFDVVSSRLDPNPSSKAFFINKPELQKYIHSAKKIYLCGVNLTNTIEDNLRSIQNAVNDGREVYILIIDPDTTALEVAGRRTNTEGQKNYYKTKLSTTIDLLENIYLCNHKAAKKLHVGLLPYPPSFGILGFDLDGDPKNGKIFVEIYFHKIGDQSPRFELSYIKDESWYVHFSEQFTKMWSDARIWTPAIPLSSLKR